MGTGKSSRPTPIGSTNASPADEATPALKHRGSIHNPVFYEKQRMRFSTWDTPRFIRCYQEDLHWLHLPRGLVERVTELVAELGSKLEIVDDRPTQASLGLRFRSELRAQQQGAVDAVLPHDRGVIVAPPGSGKTVMACAVIAERDVPTLVPVDRKPLLEQWGERLVEHVGPAENQVGRIGGGKNDQSRVVDVAMIQTSPAATTSTTSSPCPSRTASSRHRSGAGSASPPPHTGETDSMASSPCSADRLATRSRRQR